MTAWTRKQVLKNETTWNISTYNETKKKKKILIQHR